MARKDAATPEMMPTDLENKFLSKAQFEEKYRKAAEKKAFLKSKAKEFDRKEAEKEEKKEAK